MYEDGTIEGVYEAVKGFAKAIVRRDREMALWFADRIKPEQEEELKRLEGEHYKSSAQIITELEENTLKELRGPLFYDLYYLQRVLLTGRVNLLDQIIHSNFILPEGFSIEKDIARYYRYGNDPLKEPFPLYDLPLQNIQDGDAREMMFFAFLSSDVRIVDFFHCIFRDRD